MKRSDHLALTLLGIVWGAVISAGGAESVVAFLITAAACATLMVEPSPAHEGEAGLH